MEEQQQHIDEMFRRSLSDYRETPPAAVWDRITQQLDADEDKKPKAFFLRWQWALLLLLLIGGSTWMLIAQFQHSTKDNTLAHTNASSNTSNTYQNTTNASLPSAETILTTPASGSATESGNKLTPASEKHGNKNAQQFASNSSSSPKQASGKEVPAKMEPGNTAEPHDQHRALIDPRISGNRSISRRTNSGTKNKEDIANQGLTAGNNLPLQHANNTGLSNPEPVNIENNNPDVAGNQHQSEAPRKPGAMYAHSEAPPYRFKEELPTSLVTTDIKLSKIASKEKKLAQSGVPVPVVIVPTHSLVQAPKRASAHKQALLTSNKRTNKNSISRSSLPGQTVTAVGKHLSSSPIDKKQAPASNTPAKRSNSATADPSVVSAPVIQHTTKSVGLSGSANTPVSTNAEPNLAGPGIPVKSKAVGMQTAKNDPSDLSAGKKFESPADTTPKTGLTTPPIELPTDSNLKKTRGPGYFTLTGDLGFEFGTASLIKSRLNFAFGLMWHISDAFAIGVQPAIRFGSLATQLTNDQTYQQSVTTVNNPFMTFDASPTVYGHRDTIYNYVVQQKFDSIVVRGVSAKGIMWEIELPLLLSYQFQKNWNIYAGPSINLGGKLPGLSGETATTYTTFRKDSIAQSVPKPLSEFTNYFGPPSSLPNYANYQKVEVSNPSSVRAGYLIGAGYKRGRIVFDASMHQQLSGYSNLNADLKKLYAAPYFRIGIGYYLIPAKKQVLVSKNH